jgi:hypothetical protein
MMFPTLQTHPAARKLHSSPKEGAPHSCIIPISARSNSTTSLGSIISLLAAKVVAWKLLRGRESNKRGKKEENCLGQQERKTVFSPRSSFHSYIHYSWLGPCRADISCILPVRHLRSAAPREGFRSIYVSDWAPLDSGFTNSSWDWVNILTTYVNSLHKQNIHQQWPNIQ